MLREGYTLPALLNILLAIYQTGIVPPKNIDGINNWKGIRSNIHKGNLLTELFDLDNDIQEKQNVAAVHPEIIQQMVQIMKAAHNTPAVSTFLMKALEGN